MVLFMDIYIKNGAIFVADRELPLLGYDVCQEIGRGANAKVFQIYNKMLDRNEAIKIWVPRNGKQAVNSEQFYSELRKNAKFTNNDSIATVYSGKIVDRIYYCIMEYCPGITLKEFLSKNPSWIYRRGLARQISDTMSGLTVINGKKSQ